jgi:hypothetical protein
MERAIDVPRGNWTKNIGDFDFSADSNGKENRVLFSARAARAERGSSTSSLIES